MYMYLNPITIAPKLNYYVPVEERDENKTATNIFCTLTECLSSSLFGILTTDHERSNTEHN